MDVDEKGGLFEGDELKLNSYDLGVDIELADAYSASASSIRRCEWCCCGPAATGLLRRANLRMLAGASHVHKVNFCKFTNETRNAIEEASAASGLPTISSSTAPRPAAVTSRTRGRSHRPGG